MSEELVGTNEDRLATDHPSIFQLARTKPMSATHFDQYLEHLAYVSQNGASPEQARRELSKCVGLLEGPTAEQAESPLGRLRRPTGIKV
jgi:hypothetical protein